MAANMNIGQQRWQATPTTTVIMEIVTTTCNGNGNNNSRQCSDIWKNMNRKTSVSTDNNTGDHWTKQTGKKSNVYFSSMKKIPLFSLVGALGHVNALSTSIAVLKKCRTVHGFSRVFRPRQLLSIAQSINSIPWAFSLKHNVNVSDTHHLAGSRRTFITYLIHGKCHDGCVCVFASFILWSPLSTNGTQWQLLTLTPAMCTDFGYYTAKILCIMTVVNVWSFGN